MARYLSIIILFLPLCVFSNNYNRESALKLKIIKFDSLTKISNIQEEDKYFCFWVRRTNYPYFTAFVYDYNGNRLFDYTLQHGGIKNVGLSSENNIFYIILNGGKSGDGQDSIKAFNIDTGNIVWVTCSAANRYELSPYKKFIVGTSPHMSTRTHYDIVNLVDGGKIEIANRPALIKIKNETSLFLLKSRATYQTAGPISLSIYDIASKSIKLEKELSHTNDLMLNPDPPSAIYIDSEENIYVTSEHRDRNNGIKNVLLKFDKEFNWIWTKELGFKRVSILSYHDSLFILASNGKKVDLINSRDGSNFSPVDLFSSLDNLIDIDYFIPRNWTSDYCIVPRRLKVDVKNSSIEILR